MKPNQLPSERPIRFKARSKKDGKWVEGYYAILHEPHYDRDEHGWTPVWFDPYPSIFNNEEGHRDDHYWTDVYPQTLCQMTGMKDINDQPIWEHDEVVLHPVGDYKTECFMGEVVFLETCFAIETDTNKHMPIYDVRKHYDIEVTGNRYDKL